LVANATLRFSQPQNWQLESKTIHEFEKPETLKQQRGSSTVENTYKSLMKKKKLGRPISAITGSILLQVHWRQVFEGELSVCRQKKETQ